MGNILGWWKENLRKIKKNNRRRQKNFAWIRTRVHSEDPETVKKRQEIVALPLNRLLDSLRSDNLKPTEVLEAYFWKALTVNEEINCVADCIVEAFEQARSIEEKWCGNIGKPPLYGLPFSVKSSLFVKGYDCTAGLAKHLDDPKEVDCTLIAHLRRCGAIPFIVTNVPAGLLSYSCSNALYGTTFNPFNLRRSPGGSSGGDAALVATNGSPFSIGTDIMGCLRNPAAFCGVTTLKPTEARLTSRNLIEDIPGRMRLALCFGFITRTVEEQLPLLSNVLGSFEYYETTPRCVPLQLDHRRVARAGRKPLRLGYFVDDGFLKPVPACARAVIDTVEALKSEGHDLVLFKLPYSKTAASLFFKTMFPDNGKHKLQQHKYEPADHDFGAPSYGMLKYPAWVRSTISFLLRYLSPQLATEIGGFTEFIPDYSETCKLIDQYKEEFTREWEHLGLDGLICPAFTVPAISHSYANELTVAFFSTGLFNMLDLPAGVVPVGKVTKDDDEALLNKKQWATGWNPVLRKMKAAASNSAGLPVAVQVVTPPYREEECFAIMKIIEKIHLR